MNDSEVPNLYRVEIGEDFEVYYWGLSENSCHGGHGHHDTHIIRKETFSHASFTFKE